MTHHSLTSSIRQERTRRGSATRVAISKPVAWVLLPGVPQAVRGCSPDRNMPISQVFRATHPWHGTKHWRHRMDSVPLKPSGKASRMRSDSAHAGDASRRARVEMALMASRRGAARTVCLRGTATAQEGEGRRRETAAQTGWRPRDAMLHRRVPERHWPAQDEKLQVDHQVVAHNEVDNNHAETQKVKVCRNGALRGPTRGQRATEEEKQAEKHKKNAESKLCGRINAPETAAAGFSRS